jgi:hypothetical protein
VSVRRHEFDAAYERLVARDVEVHTDPEQAWADFVAARAQYDEVLLALAALTMAPKPVVERPGDARRSRLQPGGRRHIDPIADPESRGVATTPRDRVRAVPSARPRTPDPTALDGGLEQDGDGAAPAAGLGEPARQDTADPAR